MQNSKLFTLLQSLTKGELSKFDEYVHTSIPNLDKSSVELFDILKTQSPKFPTKPLTKKKASSLLLGKTSRRMDYSINKLTKALEEFLVILDLKKRPIKQSFALADALKRRRIDQYFFKTLMESDKKLKKTVAFSASAYNQRFNVLALQFFHPNTQLINKETNGTIEGVMDALDQNIAIQKLKYSIEMIIQAKFFKTKPKILFLPEVLSLLNDTKYDTKPIFKIYKSIVFFLQDQDKTITYENLTELIVEYINKVAHEEQLVILQFLLNYAASELGNGKTQYIQEIFKWYKFGIEQEILIVNKRINPHNFLNIVDSSFLALEVTSWAESFVQQYAKYLDKDIRRATQSFCKMTFLFKEQEYSKILTEAATYQYEDIGFALKTKSLLLKTYYELWLQRQLDADFIYTFCASFTRYINRQKIIEQSPFREANLNFIKMVKKLIKTQETYGAKTSKNSLLEDLGTMPFIINKQWLQKKIHNL